MFIGCSFYMGMYFPDLMTYDIHQCGGMLQSLYVDYVLQVLG